LIKTASVCHHFSVSVHAQSIMSCGSHPHTLIETIVKPPSLGAGIQGSRVHVGGARFDFADVYGDPLSRWEHECWAKPLWNRSIAVALVNHGSTQATLTADLAAVAAKYPAALDWSSGGQLRGREAWTGAAVRAAANGGSFSLPVDSDGVAVIVMRAR
jgi:hypothetical protein